MKNFRDVLTEFEARLQSLNLNEENSKEKIDKLSYIAIHHTQLASEFVQMIFKRIEMAHRVESRINFLYLIDSICKLWTQSGAQPGSRRYIELFERDIAPIFVKTYIKSSHSDVLKRQLRLLRMTWRNIFADASLEEMKVKIKYLEKEDIDLNFSEEDRQKLINYYRTNDIPLESLPKSLWGPERPERQERLEPAPMMIPRANPMVQMKTPRPQAQRDLEDTKDPKIKKKVKKSTTANVNMVGTHQALSEQTIKNTNVSGISGVMPINQSANMMNTTIQMDSVASMRQLPNFTENMNIKGQSNTTSLPTKSQKAVNPQNVEMNNMARQRESLEKTPNTNMVLPTQSNLTTTTQQNNEGNKKVVEEKKNVNKDDEMLKEKLRNLFGGIKQNNQQMFFYVLYKNFKDEMSKQMAIKTLHIANIKTKHEFVVNSLYTDLKFKCNSCGTRFSQQKSIIDHLDRHFVVNKYLFDIQKRDKMIERSEFLKNDEWLSFEVIPEAKKKNTFNNLNEETEHWIEADFSKNNKCALCEETFNLKYLGKKEMWIYENVILVDIEEKKLVGVPFHYNCYKILLAQEEEQEYMNEVNFIKKNENMIKSKTNNNNKSPF